MDKAQAKVFIAELLGKVIGGWTAREPLGYGKSAVVLLATNSKGDSGALKVFHPELVERYGRPVQVERIEREMMLLEADHPNVVRIFDGGACAVTGYLFVVMEVVDYPNLANILEQVPPAAVRGLLGQLAAAAMFLEEKGLAHRDIKPGNIAVSPDFKSLKLLDLGVLRPFGISDLTDVDQRPFIGTLRYSSPEFLRREEGDSLEGWRAVTFYQIGAVLHDLLMKTPLFESQSEPYSRLVEAVLTITPQLHGWDPALVQLANHCLVKNPRTRAELVSWNRFQLEESVTEEVLAKREKIRARQVYYRSLRAPEGLPLAELGRLSTQRLQELCKRFETRLGIALSSLQCFPLRKTLSRIEPDASRCSTFIHFEQDLQLGLTAHLAFNFLLQLQDENNANPIYRLSVAAALCPDEPSPAEMDEFTELAVGTGDDLMTTPKLEERLLEALNSAYDTLECNGGTIAERITLKSDSQGA